MKIGGREEIPEFPEFTGITLAIQDELEEYVNRYPCYSDFNFASLYSWNIDEDMGVSWHNGNAVFLFSDYMTGLPF